MVGCWTCKLRHVKCDSATPDCQQCTSRRIQCHGYGPKPTWMDGGEREREERQRVKSAIKKNFKRRRLYQSKAYRDRPQLSRRSSSSTPDSASEPSGSDRGDGPNQSARRNPVQSPEYIQGAATSHPHLPMTSLFARPFPYEESSLLMHYLDHVFPMQYFFHSRKTFGRGWLLWLLSKNGPLYRASLGLAALHLRSLDQESETLDVEIEYQTVALRELQEFIAKFEAGKSQGGDELLVEVIACGIALVSFEVLKGSTNNWQPHLYGSASIIRSMDLQRLLSKPPENIKQAARQHSGAESALAFHVPVIVWMDILACVYTRQKPKLPYESWLSKDSSINLENIMGCQNWAMKCIGDLGTLDEWKLNALAVGAFDVDEFDAKCDLIEDDLEAGLEALQMAAVKAPNTTSESCITRIFTTAALVQLRILSADVSSSWSLKLLHRAVTRVMSEIQAASETPSARQIIWPICIAGSVATPDQQPFFKELVKDALNDTSGMLGNGGTVLRIMEQCWEYQAEEPDVLWESSSVMMRMGINALLI